MTDGGNTFNVPLSSITSGVNTDNQNLTGASLNASNVLQIDIEDGSSTTVDLSSLEESADIAANTTAINANTTNIATNTSNIATNTTDIATNATNIATNTTGISTNATNIATNTSNIATNTSNIATNTSNIATNTTDIATNATDIATNATDIANHIAADADTNVGNEYNTAFEVSGGNLSLTDGGNTFNVPLSSITSGVNTDNQNLTGASLNASNVLQIDIEDGSSTTVNLSDLDDDITITNTVTGNRIATVAQDGGSTTDINETVTSLSQNTSTGVISYSDEEGNSDTANVVSTDSNNQISVGSDGGAFLNMPAVYSAGKINGDGTAASIYQATVTRLDEGDYEVTFTTPLANSNYIIQVSTLDCGGDCPGNGGSDYDDPGITYYSQSATGFRVNIGDSDNGANQKDDIDLEFMFTVIVLPN